LAQFVFHDVNAFTKQGLPVIGNPAAICLVDRFPDERVMGEAAFRLQSPMTSFVRRTKDPLVFEIRHFAPDGKENHVCGHATLAAAELLARNNPDLRKGCEITFKLNSKFKINAANAFTARIDGDDISLTVPAVTEMQRVDDQEFYRALAEALGVDEADFTGPAYYVPRIINYVVGLRDQETLIKMKPDFAKLKALASSAKFPHEGIMATAKSDFPGYDIMTRVFLPIIGVDEDVACGSANCSVVPYWTLKRAVFDPAKTLFRAMFPYPPRTHEGVVGGVQDLSIDHTKKEVTIRGQASYQRAIVLNINPRPRGPGLSPS
jgi:PhzF family phenazine biosynthesis protein